MSLEMLEEVEAPAEMNQPDVATEIDEITPTEKPIKGLKDLGHSRKHFFLDPRKIRVIEDHNPRDFSLAENREHINALKESIRQNGVISPLWVRFNPDRKEADLVDGQCRLIASLDLVAEGMDITVPCIEVPGVNEPDRLLRAIIANQGKPFNSLEEGTAFQRLHQYGWSVDKIAKKTGKQVVVVRRLMELADTPEDVKTLVAEGKITPTLAVAEVREHGCAAVATLHKLAEEAQAKGKKTATKRHNNRRGTTLIVAVRKLLKDVTREQLDNDEWEWLEVSRLKLRAVADALEA